MEPKVTELHVTGNPPRLGMGTATECADWNILESSTHALELTMDQSLSS